MEQANSSHGSSDSGDIWIEYIKKILNVCGNFDQSISLIIKERGFSSEVIIENIHYLISNGFIPNLYTSIDWEELRQSANTKAQNMSIEAYINYFTKNIKNNLRIFMTFSPLGQKLKEFVRKYPSLIDHTTCISFTDWPEKALKEVAKEFINKKILFGNKEEKSEEKQKIAEEQNEDNENEEENEEQAKAQAEMEDNNKELTTLLSIADIFAQMHLGVTNNIIEMMKRETKRQAYFTSMNFITLIKTFNKFLDEKIEKVKYNISKYKTGIAKIQAGKIKIEEMKAE